MSAKDSWVVDLLKLFQFEYCSELFWRDNYPNDGDFYIGIMCNDVFAWGTADVEDITKEDIPDLKAEFEEQKRLQNDTYPDAWYIPWIAKKRGQRPQGAMYKYLPQEVADVINNALPEREINLLNPYTEDHEYKYEKPKE